MAICQRVISMRQWCGLGRKWKIRWAERKEQRLLLAVSEWQRNERKGRQQSAVPSILLGFRRTYGAVATSINNIRSVWLIELLWRVEGCRVADWLIQKRWKLLRVVSFRTASSMNNADFRGKKKTPWILRIRLNAFSLFRRRRKLLMPCRHGC